MNVPQRGAYTDTLGVARMLVGYARVSTQDQDLEVQLGVLRELGVSDERMYWDRGFTGKNLDRDGLHRALAAVRDGDTLVVPKMDRFARNAEETLRLVRELTERGVAFQMGRTVYDPRDPFSKMFLTFLAAVAEAEGGWISLRTQESMARPSVRAKLRGKQPSKTPREDAAIAGQVALGELSISEIARMFNTSRSGVYRALDRHNGVA